MKNPKLDFNKLDKIVADTLTKVFAVMYESGLVKEVALSDVMRLFGTDLDLSEYNEVIKFDDPEFLDRYNKLKDVSKKVKPLHTLH